jgi:hypothetical protein
MKLYTTVYEDNTGIHRGAPCEANYTASELTEKVDNEMLAQAFIAEHGLQEEFIKFCQSIQDEYYDKIWNRTSG